MRTYLKEASELTGCINYIVYDQNKLTSVWFNDKNENVYIYKHDDLAEFIFCVNYHINENNAEVINRYEFKDALNTLRQMYDSFITR